MVHTKPKSQNRGTRMPEDWRPSEEAVQFCLENISGCTADIINQQFPCLKDWALTTSGQRALKRDWNRYFINWIRTSMQ